MPMNFEPTPHELAALRAGNLSLILRPVVPQPESDDGVLYRNGRHFSPEAITAGNDASHPCPLGQPGDVLAVREDWAVVGKASDPGVWYRSTEGDQPEASRIDWQPAETMPDWAVRYRLRRVGEARCLRLQGLSDDDAFSCGYAPFWDKAHPEFEASPNGGRLETWPLRGPLDALRVAWGEDNPGHPHARDPYVWAASVEVVV